MNTPRAPALLALALATSSAGDGNVLANDDISNATQLTGNTFSSSVLDIDCATLDPDEPPTIFGSETPESIHTVWYQWTAPQGDPTAFLELRLQSSDPLVPTRFEVFVPFNGGPQLAHIQTGHVQTPTPFPINPGTEYFIRIAVNSAGKDASTLAMELTGKFLPGPTNTSFEDRAPLVNVPASLSTSYTSAGTELWWSWTPDTSGYVDFRYRFPARSILTIFQGTDLFAPIPNIGPVVAGQNYTVRYSVGNGAGPFASAGGFLHILPAAANDSFAARIPASTLPFAPGDPRTKIVLQADDTATAFWWSWTAPESGTILISNQLNSSLGNQVHGFLASQPDTVFANPGTFVQVAAGTQLSFRVSSLGNGALVTEPDRSAVFFPGNQAAPIVDENLLHGIQAALRLPLDPLVTPSLLLDLDYLHIRARADCDDDDCFAPARPVASLEGIQGATNLTELYLQGGEGEGHLLSDLSPIAGLTSLESLRLPNALKATDAELLDATTDIGGLTNLGRLSLEQNNLQDQHIVPLSTLTQLTTLDLDDNNITDLSPIAGLAIIRTLDIDENPITDLSPLASLQQLSNLDATQLPHGIRTLPPLRRLYYIQANDHELGPLARLTNLGSIRIDRRHTSFLASRITDLSPLANLPSFGYVSLDFISNGGITDLSPITPRFTPLVSADLVARLIDNSKVNLDDPKNIAALQEFADAGRPVDTSILITYPTLPGNIIPDGRLRAATALAVGITQDDLNPTTIATPTRITTGWVRTLEGMQHATGLTSLEAAIGWITDLTPIAGLDNISTLNLADNYVSDLTPIADLEFGILELRSNPIDPTTVPAAWLNNPNVRLDPFHQLDTAQTIHDPELRAAIKATLHIPNASPLDPADLALLTTLRAEDLRIRSLAGLEHATNLQALSVRNNIIRDITPITGLTNLRWLRTAGNPSALDTSLLDPSIDIDDHEASRFDSTISAADGTVYADDYQLTSARYLALFPEAHTLYLSGNYISDISVLAKLPNLTTVHLDNNYLTADSQPAIDALRARGVTVVTDPQRPEVDAEFQIAGPALQHAIANSLNLGPVPPAFSAGQLASITRLDWNDAISISTTGPTIWSTPDTPLLARMPELVFLKIERGGISDISAISGLTKLQELDLDFNAISDISPVAELTRLTELDLNNNDIRDITPLSGLTSLLSLDLDQNHITDISPLAALTSLIELDLHGNAITHIDVIANFTNLASLDLRENRIRDLSPLAGLTGLIYLDASLNGLDLDTPAQADALANLRGLGATLVPYPQLLPEIELEPSGNQIAIRWTGEPHTSYTLRATSDFKTYFNITTVNVTATPTPVEIFHPFNPDTPHFFHIVVQSQPAEP